MTTAFEDRCAGVLLATAAGDALGAPYEFLPPLAPDAPVGMTGNGTWEPGEWTDDTAMAIAIAEVAADGLDLREPAAQDRVVVRWREWMAGAKDVGIQTRRVLSAAPDAVSARAAARDLHERTGRSGGNGSLMRTAPVALAFLHDEHDLVDAATRLSTLTHHDPQAGEACVLWCLTIRHAVLTGHLDLRVGLPLLPEHAASYWADRIAAAERSVPSDFPDNGWVVSALQAAWCAIASTSGSDHLRRALEAAARGGFDTDTVAAIAGGLLGAACGASAVPAEWVRVLHGWPGLEAADLIELAGRIVNRPGR